MFGSWQEAIFALKEYQKLIEEHSIPYHSAVVQSCIDLLTACWDKDVLKFEITKTEEEN